MKPRIVLESCPLPGERVLELHQHDGRPALHVHGEQLVAAQTAASEAGTAGSLCARIYDVGNLTEPLPFVLTVEHP